MSADGQTILATGGNTLYTSTDGGATWTTRSCWQQGWEDHLAVSANGQTMVAAEGGSSTVQGYIYTSTNGGAILWVERTSAGLRSGKAWS